jgi:hypothetical protein
VFRIIFSGTAGNRVTAGPVTKKEGGGKRGELDFRDLYEGDEVLRGVLRPALPALEKILKHPILTNTRKFSDIKYPIVSGSIFEPTG